MSLLSFANWLDATPVSVAIKDDFWIVPSVQSVHILSVCLVFSGAVIVALRAWGLVGMAWTAERWAHRLYPVQWWALLILLVTGSILVIGEPARELPNTVFQIKMICVVVASILSLWLMKRFYRTAVGDGRDVATRMIGTIAASLWVVVICAGRWIAYT